MPRDINDNIDRSPPESHPVPDAHGQAALVLVESLLHALVENGSLTNCEALRVTERAVEVKIDVAEESKEPKKVMRRSLALLSAIGNSLRSDEISVVDID